MKIPYDTREEYLYITMYSDKECTKEILGYSDINISQDSCVSLYRISLPGTYYVKFKLSSYGDFADNVTYHITYSIMPTVVVLESSISYLGLQSDIMSQQHKIVVKEPGFIKVSLGWPIPTTQYDSRLSLWISNVPIPIRSCFKFGKESLDKTYCTSDYYFVVGKGTYYIRIYKEAKNSYGHYSIAVQ